MQQMWCADDASQSMQSLWFLQQERNRFSGSLIQAIRKQIRMGLLFCMGNRRQFLPSTGSTVAIQYKKTGRPSKPAGSLLFLKIIILQR